jgi:hypothetical protein
MESKGLEYDIIFIRVKNKNRLFIPYRAEAGFQLALSIF